MQKKYVGVYLKKDGWYARVTHNRKATFYGPFKTELQAAKEYENVRSRNLNKKLKSGSVRQHIAEKNVRKHFSQMDRNGIAAKQSWKCNMCNDALDAHYEIDHLLPLQYGGTNGYRNLQAICLCCHRFKTQYLDSKIKQFAEEQQVVKREDIETIQNNHLHKMKCEDDPTRVDLRAVDDEDL